MTLPVLSCAMNTVGPLSSQNLWNSCGRGPSDMVDLRKQRCQFSVLFSQPSKGEPFWLLCSGAKKAIKRLRKQHSEPATFLAKHGHSLCAEIQLDMSLQCISHSTQLYKSWQEHCQASSGSEVLHKLLAQRLPAEPVVKTLSWHCISSRDFHSCLRPCS